MSLLLLVNNQRLICRCAWVAMLFFAPLSKSPTSPYADVMNYSAVSIDLSVINKPLTTPLIPEPRRSTLMRLRRVRFVPEWIENPFQMNRAPLRLFQKSC